MPDDVTLTSITVTRILTPDGDEQTAVTVDGDDHLVTLLGLFELAKDTVLANAMSDDTTDEQD